MEHDFTDSFQLPKDVIYRDSLISLTGQRELYLENHKKPCAIYSKNKYVLDDELLALVR